VGNYLVVGKQYGELWQPTDIEFAELGSKPFSTIRTVSQLESWLPTTMTKTNSESLAQQVY
jgi:hypothetical protein